MSASLWASTAEQLLRRTSSADPTPGGGAIAAVTAAFGVGLVRMAIAVTSSGAGTASNGLAHLEAVQGRAAELQAAVAEAADRDIAEFDALMLAYRMPRDGDDERSARARAIDAATIAATHGPLGLAEASIAGISLANQVEPLVKSTIVSDVQAGRDLLRGAALAALRTADINLAALEQRGHPEAALLRQRRNAVHRAVASAQERE